MPRRCNTTGTTLTAAQRRQAVLDLRIKGETFSEIGRKLGITKQSVYSHIRKALDDLAQASKDRTAELRELANERLEALLAAHWEKAAAGDVGAARLTLSIVSQQVRLYGAEAPAKIAPTSPDGETPYQAEETTRWVYFLPQPCETEEEWVTQYGPKAQCPA